MSLDIPRDLLEEARDGLGITSETETVVFALRMLVRRQRIEELKSLLGEVDLEIDRDGS